MSAFVILLFSILVLLLAYLLNFQWFLSSPHLSPPLLGFFGPPETLGQKSGGIEPFEIPYDADQIELLKRKLNETIFFESLPGAKFHYGANDQFLRKLNDYWLNIYDWSKWTKILNKKFKHYKTNVAGLNLHYARLSPNREELYTEENIRPILLLHGWPGSIFEFYKLAPILAGVKDEFVQERSVPRKFAFDVIAPSIPGYCWSDKPAKIGFGPVATAQVFAKLMIHKLNIKQFYCQGGDWGSLICTYMAQMYPENILGVHLNMGPMPLNFPIVWFKLIIGYFTPSLIFDNPEIDYGKVYPLGARFITLLQESGYFHIQATKPDTVGFALLNSPMSLAAYLSEKFSSWTNLDFRGLTEGGLNRHHFTLDELLTNIMIYYTTGTIITSQRFYKEWCTDSERTLFESSPVPSEVPVGIAAFPNEPVKTAPETLLKHKYHNLTLYQDMPRGGHFAALEEPGLLAGSIFDFVCKVENVC